jgi:hypothetical protein
MELTQPKVVEPLTRLPGVVEVLESVAVHFVALDGDVRVARLDPAFVKVTPVGGLGVKTAPPSLNAFVKDPSVNAAKATPETKVNTVNTATSLNETRRVNLGKRRVKCISSRITYFQYKAYEFRVTNSNPPGPDDRAGIQSDWANRQWMADVSISTETRSNCSLPTS